MKLAGQSIANHSFHLSHATICVVVTAICMLATLESYEEKHRFYTFWVNEIYAFINFTFNILKLCSRSACDIYSYVISSTLNQNHKMILCKMKFKFFSYTLNKSAVKCESNILKKKIM